MKALVIYESMYGNTRRVAQVVAAALGALPEVRLVHADDALAEDVAGADLVVIGAPTHAWGLPRANTRRGASTKTVTSEGLALEPGADTKSGVRELLTTLRAHELRGWFAAFDTRRRGPRWLTGRASTTIAAELTRLGMRELVSAESFYVDRRDHLIDGELDRAASWGERLRHDAAAHVSHSA